MDPLLALLSKHRPSNLILRENTNMMKDTLNAVVIFLASMAVNDDLSQQIETGNVLQGIHSILKNHFHSQILTRNTVVLLRYLCSSHKVREKSSTYALMKWVVEIMENYKKSADTVEVAMSCCAHMTLRNSCQVAQLVAKNGLPLILELMKDFRSNVTILKSACVTLRNMIENGDPDVKTKIKELYAPTFNELLALLELREYYVKPLIKELGLNGEKSDINNGEDERPDTVAYEVNIGRKSVVLDDNMSSDNIVPT
ncbi:Armadillo repeat-containing protein 6 [Orchesella cincta]|uniref:Armadillo repeat-containing protein 6 n=1 Tax=Orchesella cincta TaxID=48709 RepID=A0A1D2MAX1_ORCCI|nr:Armadillo repeat-containing protein 6 [Orchesella cincta]